MKLYEQEIPTVGYLQNISTLPDDVSQFDIGEETTRMQRAIVEYYRRNPNFALVSFDLLDTNGEIIHSTDSLFGRPFDDRPVVDSIDLSSYSFSDYSNTHLESLGFDTDSNWNGDTTFVIYNDGDTIIGETDYYSFSTFLRLLQYEAIYAANIAEDASKVRVKDFPLRNELLRSKSDFYYPKRPIPASSGGVLIFNTPNGWRMLLGRRSTDVSVNPGMISIFPNGGVEYADLWGGGFDASARREFGEELFNDDIEAGNKFINEHCITKRVACGWNVREGSMFFGHAFISPHIEGYHEFIEKSEPNEELEGIVEIDIFNPKEVHRFANIDSMSGAAISAVYYALEEFDQNESYPDLPYDIRKRLK